MRRVSVGGFKDPGEQKDIVTHMTISETNNTAGVILGTDEKAALRKWAQYATRHTVSTTLLGLAEIRLNARGVHEVPADVRVSDTAPVNTCSGSCSQHEYKH